MNDTVSCEEFSISGAAKLATALGRPTSTSKLYKVRMVGPNEPRDRGPDFMRDASGRCWYSREAIERWVSEWKANRQFRAPGRSPIEKQAA